ncbi:hypothetical protein CEXT_658971 [Caerostris extrusa]|uniref:Uncharacterized protein n=1 Tax=Caerostris extrusa TaxID=172846 RepID=A0AAV4P2M4_CAEEX|nr:hypothetical protein CEXT_658971 [Caerostris extrusa]
MNESRVKNENGTKTGDTSKPYLLKRNGTKGCSEGKKEDKKKKKKKRLKIRGRHSNGCKWGWQLFHRGGVGGLKNTNKKKKKKGKKPKEGRAISHLVQCNAG